MKMRLLAEIDKFLRWWGEGLALVVPKSWRNRQQRLKQYLLLQFDHDEVVIEHYQDGRDTPTTRRSISIKEEADQSRARDWFEKSPPLLALPTIIRLKSDHVLVKRLRYPSAVRDDLKNVIAFDIDRQTPFSREDVYFDFDDVTAPGAEHLDVDLLLVPRKELEILESVLRQIDLRVTAIDIEDRTIFDSGVNLLPNRAGKESHQPPYRLGFALLALWMVLIALIPGKQVLDAQAAIEHLKKQERAGIAAAQPLNQLREEHARLIEKLNYFNALQIEYIPVLDVLHDVTHLLSDNTWIRRFDLKNGTLTLQGESKNASEIPGILEGSTRLSSSKFSSPVTRNNSTGNDRFQILVSIDTPRRK